MTAFHGFPLHNQGGQYGLSGQANQQGAGNSAQSQLGNYFNQSQQRYAQQLHLAQYAQQYTPAVTPPAVALKTSAIKLGEIIGWRGWRLTPNGFLRSMSVDACWPPGEVMEGKTKSISEDNGCYAYKSARLFLEHLSNAGLDIYGQVAMWGDVIEHELGYRAEFAKVISLKHFLHNRAPHGLHIKALREKYCPEAA